MRLSSKGQCAVMAVVDPATHTNGKPETIDDIAERQTTSPSYLERLFSKLRRAGQVRIRRGPGGGYLLADSTTCVRFADVILTLDEPIRGTCCVIGSPRGYTEQRGRCLTHGFWERLGNQIHMFLSTISPQDVVNRRVLSASRLPMHEVGIAGWWREGEDANTFDNSDRNVA